MINNCVFVIDPFSRLVLHLGPPLEWDSFFALFLFLSFLFEREKGQRDGPD